MVGLHLKHESQGECVRVHCLSSTGWSRGAVQVLSETLQLWWIPGELRRHWVKIRQALVWSLLVCHKPLPYSSCLPSCDWGPKYYCPFQVGSSGPRYVDMESMEMQGLFQQGSDVGVQTAGTLQGASVQRSPLLQPIWRTPCSFLLGKQAHRGKGASPRSYWG